MHKLSLIIPLFLSSIIHRPYQHCRTSTHTFFWISGTTLSCLPLLAAATVNQLLIFTSYGFAAALAYLLTCRPAPWADSLYKMHDPISVVLCANSYVAIIPLAKQLRAVSGLVAPQKNVTTIEINGTLFHNGIRVMSTRREASWSGQRRVFLSHILQEQTVSRRGPKSREISSKGADFHSVSKAQCLTEIQLLELETVPTCLFSRLR